jgi:hypothetical protein
MTTVVVRGFDYICWKCRQDTTRVVAVHAERSQKSDDWLWFEDKHALSLARDLLQQAGMTALADKHKGAVQQDGRRCLLVQRLPALRCDPG